MSESERKKLGVYIELMGADLFIIKNETVRLKEHITRAIKAIKKNGKEREKRRGENEM